MRINQQGALEVQVLHRLLQELLYSVQVAEAVDKIVVAALVAQAVVVRAIWASPVRTE